MKFRSTHGASALGVFAAALVAVSSAGLVFAQTPAPTPAPATTPVAVPQAPGRPLPAPGW